MEMPEIPKLYMESPKIADIEKEIQALTVKSTLSFAWKDNWRDKQAMATRIEQLKKRLDIVFNEERTLYDNAMKKYETEMVEYEKDVKERQEKLTDPIKSLDVEDE